VPKSKPISAKPLGKFRLEDHLLLTKFIANKLGMKEISDIKEFSDAPEGFDLDGRSYVYHMLITRRGNTIPEAKLRQYDDNIRRYFENLKRNREEKISLKYFQYLALLFSEIYLDNYFQNPVKFLNEINDWISENRIEIGPEELFSRNDLQKIAYWMATGSGKTLITHANYWQFMTYNKGPKKLDFENIILITPNDEMSKQHLEELQKSGIPAKIFDSESSSYFKEDPKTVKVISIHKLKLPEDKKGEGVTIDVSTLGTKNLVFVDEGHKGHRSEDMKWKRTREELAKNGFTFEYSATFGQAIANSREESFKEYSKAILFDYSYKYFYGDGYGKDFRIINLDTKTFTDSQTPILLLADAMAYYEQILLHGKTGNSLKDYMIEKPLWVFVGSKVREDTSDVLKVVQFINWLLTEDEKTIRTHIENILKGHSGIIADKKDVFAPRYPERNFIHLRSTDIKPDEIYKGIFNRIFSTKPGITGRKLHLINLKNVEGEIGLRVGASEKYFGVINIGNKSEFLKLIEQKAKNITVENAAISSSLFEEINQPTSTINILIGAKKFIEGWNSWRVSNMCLLNIGKREGSQIIQLFGRGVRLKGRDYSLKRSRFIPPPHPEDIEVLETLNIFGIKANYMKEFREIIEKEDIPTYELPLITRPIKPFPTDLKILGLREGASFEKILFAVEPEEEIDVKVDLLPRAMIIDGREEQTLATTTDQSAQTIDKRVLDLLDWNEIYCSVLNHKNERDLFNITFTKDSIKKIIYDQKYTLLCNKDLIEPKNFGSLENVKDIVVLILKKYIDRYYSKKRNAWEKKNLEVKTLKAEDENILDSYRVQINEDDQVLIKNVEAMIESGRIYTSRSEVKPIGDLMTYISKHPPVFKNAYFKDHLYQPLLVKQESKRIVTIPMGLNEGEAEFVEDLAAYLASATMANEVYLLRNLTRSKGVGFYGEHSFYPDFIMWIKENEKQTIVFIDPKGLIFIRGLDDPKLQLHEYLRNQVQKELEDPNIELNAFIISTTSYNVVRRRLPLQPPSITNYENSKHILFPYLEENRKNSSYIERLFEITMNK